MPATKIINTAALVRQIKASTKRTFTGTDVLAMAQRAPAESLQLTHVPKPRAPAPRPAPGPAKRALAYDPNHPALASTRKALETRGTVKLSAKTIDDQLRVAFVRLVADGKIT